MIKDTKIGVKGMEVWKKSPLFHGMTEQEIGHLLVQAVQKKTIRKRNICLFRGGRT